MEVLSFEKLVRFFKKRERDNEFKGLSNLRSISAPKVASTSTMPQGQRALCSQGSDLYQRKGGPTDVLCLVCNRWGHPVA